MRPVRGSTRSIVFESRSPTQRDPKPSSTPNEDTKHLTRPLSLLGRGSTRMTLGVPLLTTQTAPGVLAIPSGCGPTGIVAPIELSRGSIRKTVSSETREIHTASMPFFFQAEDGIRDYKVTGVQTCALPI